MRLARSILLVAIAALVFVPGSAHATVAANMLITFPFEATVGQTGLPASIEMGNINGPPQDGDTNTICNAGDAAPCASPENGIALVPSCKETDGNAQCTGADPGVFGLSATGTGRATTACADAVFDIVSTGDSLGTVRFVPRPTSSHVTLPGTNTKCAIDFTVDVLKFPTGDEKVFTDGTQTTPVGEHTQISGADSHHKMSPSFFGVTITKSDSASVATTASPNVALGSGTLTDSATVSGVTSPQAGATIEFKLYGPDDATCSGTPVFTSTKPASPSGTTATATSDAFTPTATGTYRWTASYSGDVNNNAKAGACNDANESTTVTTAAPGGGGGGGGGGIPDPKPVITGFKLSPASFKVKAGSKFKFTLSEAASVRVVVDRSAAGRRAGGKCRAPSKSNRKRPKCTRFVRVSGAVKLTGESGANSLKFNGKVGGRSLKAGKYRATATATDSAGQASAAVRAAFTVKKP